MLSFSNLHQKMFACIKQLCSILTNHFVDSPINKLHKWNTLHPANISQFLKLGSHYVEHPALIHIHL